MRGRLHVSARPTRVRWSYLACARGAVDFVAGMPAVHQVSASAMTIDALDSYLIQHTMQAGALYVAGVYRLHECRLWHTAWARSHWLPSLLHCRLVGGARQTLAYNTSQCNFLPIAMNLVAGAALRSFRNDHGFQDNAVPTTVAYAPPHPPAPPPRVSPWHVNSPP